MKHLTIAAFALAMATTAARATADGCAIVGRTPDGFLNLRALPMGDSRVISKLIPGDLIYISDATCETKGSLSVCNNQGWTSVDAVRRLDGRNLSKRERNHRGWVATRFLRFIDCETADKSAN
jgi:hypothetical protein